MGIEAVRSATGQPRANCACDQCGREEIVAARFERRRGQQNWVNDGPVLKKLLKSGWSHIKNTLRCPACEARRKALAHEESKKLAQQVGRAESVGENAMKAAVNTTPKMPEPKQKRLIIIALEDAYDDAAKRYRGGATDKTVADELGGGIMPGWVSDIREEMFGPAGNEEVDALRVEMLGVKSQVEAMLKRLEAITASHDKRVRA